MLFRGQAMLFRGQATNIATIRPAAIHCGQMTPLRAVLLRMLFWSLLVLGLAGCAQQDSEPMGPLTLQQHPNTSISGYMRSGVMFSGH
jgi:hypothetical protein